MTDWIGELSPRARVLVASSSLPLALGHFRCAPGDPAWGQVNRIGDVAHVVVPRTSVAITPMGAPTLAADANRALVYAAGQEYRRARLDPRGDDSLFVAVGEAALEAIAGPDRGGAPGAGVGTTADRPCPAAVFAALQTLRATAATADRLVVEEMLVAVVAEVLGVDAGDRPTPAARRQAEVVRSLLAARFREPLSLAEVADAVGVSPYHLHRRFRAATGWTIHAYREHLRLREGLAAVVDGAEDLAAVAHELGFASHSHFTARFRRAFGMTPSTVRRRGPRATARS